MYLGVDISPSTETLNFLCERNEPISLIKLVENFDLDPDGRILYLATWQSVARCSALIGWSIGPYRGGPEKGRSVPGLKLQFSTSLIKLIGSFLSQRKFRVSVEDEMSTPRYMQAGVPQGSVLSPTLYNLYINDTPQTQSKIKSGQGSQREARYPELVD
jgi:hypothetical protein